MERYIILKKRGKKPQTEQQNYRALVSHSSVSSVLSVPKDLVEDGKSAMLSIHAGTVELLWTDACLASKVSWLSYQQ